LIASSFSFSDRPRVAWVPIESRNISEVVSKALEGSEERLVRIGKMLSCLNRMRIKSYQIAVYQPCYLHSQTLS
ncbi:hypothetical protein ANCDUO_18162, partial [Ancylostoma duodenale]